MTNSKRGIVTVICVVAIQLTIGIAYVWSVFQSGVAESLFGAYKNPNASAALTFSLLLAAMTIGSVIGGKLTAKIPVRIVVLIGGLMVAAGFFLAGFVTSPKAAWVLWLTYGVLGGFGMGFTYTPSIGCAQRWYPHKKGLITGIIVAALGFGTVIFTPIIRYLLQPALGYSYTFMVLSAIFLVVCTACSIFIVNPPQGHMADKVAQLTANKKLSTLKGSDHTAVQMLKRPQFYLIIFTFMLACMGGLMMIGFADPIAQAKGINANTAAIGVMIIGLFNSLGRLVWGIISDKLGRTNTLMVLLSGLTLLPLFVNLAAGYWIFVVIALIGFFYGGLLSNIPSLTADLFGTKNVGTNYGIVLLGFGAGAIIAPQIAGYYRDVANAGGNIDLMFPAFIIASVMAAGGLIMMIVLKLLARRKNQAAPPQAEQAEQTAQETVQDTAQEVQEGMPQETVQEVPQET
ncbi:MAG: OFA family MFS transporter [Firmicutes bacterium]|nr:OFA family MFS transporter [Bacillota bacterium]